MKKKLFLFLPLALLLGCLSDTIDQRQVVPRPILQPGQVFYRCITTNGVPTLDLRISWNPSTVDTQLNFKGYFVKLYSSAPYFTPGSDFLDSVFLPPLDSAHVPKSDTMYTFLSKVVQGGRYTVRVWGERYPDPAKPDSLVLSQYPAALSFNFDSRPVSAPAEIYASSAYSGGVNLFLLPSASQSNIGMAGYVIRYIDPTNSNAHLIYFNRFQKNLSDSGLIGGKYISQLVSAPTFPSPPVEKEFKFWIKAIRQDSVESDDSIGIIWSGAERIPPAPLGVRLDTGIFMGAVGFQYNLVQVVANDPTKALPQLKVSQSSTSVLVTALNGTTFVNRTDQDTGLAFSLNKNFFPAPFADADFTETQLSFSNTGSDNGTVIYAKLKDNNRARIWFTKNSSDSTHSSSYIRTDNTILIQASFQPIEAPQLPFF